MAIFAEITEKECTMHRHLRNIDTFRESVLTSVLWLLIYCYSKSVCPSVRSSVTFGISFPDEFLVIVALAAGVRIT